MGTPSPWDYFTLEELTCQCGCGQMKMGQAFMQRLVHFRRLTGIKMPITSGYRCPAHNANVSSTGETGPHTTGRAVDIRLLGDHVFSLLPQLKEHGFTGIGLRQHGEHAKRIIHLDDLPSAPRQPRPWVWTY